MAFSTDKQTRNDLRIFDRQGNQSVFQLYNRCVTRGGAAMLEDMFQHPLSDVEAINRRSGLIRYFAEKETAFPVTPAHVHAIDPYLGNRDERTKLSAQAQSPGKKLSRIMASDIETDAILKGISAVLALLQEIRPFVNNIETPLYHAEREAMREILTIPALHEAATRKSRAKPSQEELAAYDGIFRFTYREEIEKLLRHIYRLDVYLAVASVAREKGYVFPEALPAGAGEVELEGVYHPALKNAVPNSIHIRPESNVLFLTGANMAGKSTFMKTLSIALYLAHMGFPVPATRMRFGVLDGLYTTINLPDNLGMGASHFYAEVLRLKKMAQEVSQGKRLFILFDELFRGTNVKDACEATIAVTRAFAKKRDCIFVLSTHIIEAGEVLKDQCPQIAFCYLPTTMQGSKPVYTYTLTPGITSDRHGMIIIHNENILDMLENGLKNIA